MIVDSGTDVLFVGAGPVGLATAIQAKILNPGLNITMLDKHANYQRTQKLRLDSSSFSDMPDHEDLNKIIKNFKSKKVVPIQEIESDLKDLAEKIGIQFQQKFIQEENFDEILSQFPNAGCVVGADGARSFIRNKVFDNEYSENSTAEYLVQVNYKTKSPPQKLNGKLAASQQTRAGTIVEESVGSRDNEVSIRFFVDKETYECIQEAKAKTPWGIEDERIPQELQDKINHWVDVRKRVHKEEIVEEVITLTAIELNIYSSKKMVKMFNGRVFCLVGDAAGGVPFFRSINKGFKESSKLAKSIASAGPFKPGDAESSSEEKSPPTLIQRIVKPIASAMGVNSGQKPSKIMSAFTSYQQKAKSIAFLEILAAKVKAASINILIGLIKVAKSLAPDAYIDWLETKYFQWRSEAVSLRAFP